MPGYDYIIIGGGSAGSVLAARLTEDAACRVLMIEAGGRDTNPLFHMPAGFAKMTSGLAAWGYETVPQVHMRNRVLRYTQAKVLGGGSTINAQIYIRGNRLDYDEWRQQGCTGWGFDDVLPYFRRAEGNGRLNDEFHARGGPLSVQDPRAPLPICEAFFAAAEEQGIPRNPDFNGANQDGVGFYQLTQRDGRRCSVVTAYLKPARRRPNLTIWTDAFVTRLIIEKGCATGVELAGPSGVEQIRADREVILSASTIGSPKLLMLSGIGPAAHLKEAGIKPLIDLPGIGANLQDHLDFFVIAECTGDHTYDKYTKLPWSAIAGARYLLDRRGPVASSLFETGGFWYANENARSADIQFHLGLGSGIEAGMAKMQNAGVTLNSAFMRPRSRGTVRLRSNDPAAAPLIDPNYCAEPFDAASNVKGLRLALDIMQSKALKPFVKSVRLPDPTRTSGDDLFAYGCQHGKNDFHPVGTCKMGIGEDAVVGPDLRVRGVDRLRVVDVSIMPTIITGNTNACAIMIGEKAADMIRSR